ncbi:hypothetical protein W97_02001 [Coniosporium apollinis CBS 100218]|uniref:RGS domain-containing protein n=1 Tax=Coniosporium apollinis (strain CBS 100218) TaxID=1168221 RepID=R7YMA7_CONA1|nr:uncharacterized protein W97_02001 [Coniosporium apollinis CBS 100218]EON62776.1 hypothetical protein W97_02001 [Coniosporium apollinis CBS 100218]
MPSRTSGSGVLTLQTQSTTSSPRHSGYYDDFDKKSVMSANYIPSRPLTVAIPRNIAQGPYCPRRPNLSEILANTAPPPWTLSAFMAYLSQNHCLETLEFTMDASRYRKHYNKMANRTPGVPISPTSEECVYVKMLWQRLLEAYIAPNGPREVNIPGDIRDKILALADSPVPPGPSALEPAVQKVHELMEESVLGPFLNSVSAQSAHPGTFNTSAEDLRAQTRSYDDTSVYRRSRRGSPPPHSMSVDSPASASVAFNRVSAPSSISTTFGGISRGFGGHHNRFSTQHSNRTSAVTPVSANSSNSTNVASDAGMTDSNSALSSPTMSNLSDPMTPPTTPPMSDYGYGGTGPPVGGTPSPRSSRHEGGGGGGMGNSWKRVSSKLGWKKKSVGGLREEEVEGAMF